MKKISLAFLLACTVASYGQSNGFASTSSGSAGSASASSSSAAASADSPVISPQPAVQQAGYHERQVPAGSVTESLVYTYSPNQLGANRSLMGGSIVPEFNLTHWLGMQADFTSVFVRSIIIDEDRLIMAGGPRVNLAPRSKLTPFLFAEGGEMRLSSHQATPVRWDPVAKGGFGFDYKVSPHFGMTLVPGEYLGQYQDNGTWSHSFTSRLGITFVLGRGKTPTA